MKHISICIPLYNRAADITRLIWNLNYQKDVSVIIADYDSSDIDFRKLLMNPYLELNVRVVPCKGVFNIAKATQAAVENANDSIILICDADTIYANPTETFEEIRKQVILNETYYCPNIGTVAKPTKWSSKWNGVCWVPTVDPRGFGILAVYRENYMRSGGFLKYTGGELWGGHDGYLMNQLSFLHKIRPTLGDIWLGVNDRSSCNRWYSQNGGTAWYE